MAFNIKAFASSHKVAYIGIIVGAVGVGWILYRTHEGEPVNPFSSASSSAATGAAETASATVTDPSTGTTYPDTEIDPATGLTYAADISQYGSVAAAQSALASTSSATNSSTLGTGYVSDTTTTGVSTTSGQNVYQSNSAWAQAVQAGLEDVSGTTTYNGTDIGTAIGDYLQGEPLTTAQASVVSVAIAEYGEPPVGNLQIITQPSTTTDTSSTGSAPTTKPTAAYPGPSGVAVKHNSGTSYTVSWDLIKGTTATGPTPTSYTVRVTNAATGAQVVYTTVNTPDTATGGSLEFTLPPVTKSTKYDLSVWANGTTGIAPDNTTITITET